MLDVLPRHLALVQAILHQRVPEHEVWAFGSRAKGSAWRYSDLDLAVITEAPLSYRVLGDLAEDFSESDLPFRVDIVDWARTDEGFRRLIAEDRIIVQAKPAVRA